MKIFQPVLPRDYANVKDYGAIGDGVTDDTTAIQAALDANSAIVFPSGTYKCGLITSTGSSKTILGMGDVTIIQTSASGLFAFTGGWEWAETISSIATNSVNVAYSGQTTNNMYVSQITLANARTLTRGDVVKVISDDELTGANPGSGSLKKRQGEFGIVTVDSSSTTVTLTSALRDTYTTSPLLVKLKNVSFKITNITIYVDSSILNSSSGTGTDTILIKAARDCIVENCKIHDLFSKGIKMATVNSKISKCTFYNLADQPTQNHYGYAIEDHSSFGLVVSDCHASNVRHAFTTTTDAIAVATTTYEDYGRSSGARVIGCTAEGTSSSSFDTHEESIDILFNSCRAYGAESYGFSARGYGVTFDNCVAFRCLKGFGLTGIDNMVMDSCQAIETNADGLVIEIATSHATAITTQTNVRVKNCYIEAGKNNPATSTRGIYVGRASYTTTAEIANTTVKLLSGFSGDRAFFVMSTNLTLDNIVIDLSATTHSSSGNLFGMLLNDSSCVIKGNRISMKGGATAALVQEYTAGASGNTSTLELTNTDYSHNATAPTAILGNNLSNPRLSYTNTISTTVTTSAYITQVAVAAAVPTFGKSADMVITYNLTGSAGALTMGNFPNGWKAGQVVHIYNGSNGNVTFATPSVTINTLTGASFFWTGSAWQKFLG